MKSDNYNIKKKKKKNSKVSKYRNHICTMFSEKTKICVKSQISVVDMTFLCFIEI